MAKRYKSTIASRYLRSYTSDPEDYREAEAETRAARRARARKRQVKAHKRRQAGKIVHVRGYCRRGKRSAAQVEREMPF